MSQTKEDDWLLAAAEQDAAEQEAVEAAEADYFVAAAPFNDKTNWQASAPGEQGGNGAAAVSSGGWQSTGGGWNPSEGNAPGGWKAGSAQRQADSGVPDTYAGDAGGEAAGHEFDTRDDPYATALRGDGWQSTRAGPRQTRARPAPTGYTGYSGVQNNNQQQGPAQHDLGDAESPPLGLDCPQCSVPCAVRTSNSERNPGRQFFKCQCGFFQWADQPADGQGGGGGGGGSAGECFKCGQTGHWARDCPNQGQGGGGSWGGDAGGANAGRQPYGGGNAGGAASGGGDDLSCPTCNVPCAVRTSNSERNPGRQFFKCNCGFFKWCDEAQAGGNVGGGGGGWGGNTGGGGGNTGGGSGGWGGNTGGGGSSWGGNAGGANAGSQPHGGGHAGAGGSVDDLSCPTCNVPCAVRTSNSARNPGRQFFKCNCGFFKWCDEAQAGGGGNAGGGGATWGGDVVGGSQPYGGGGGASRGGTCYKYVCAKCPHNATPARLTMLPSSQSFQVRPGWPLGTRLPAGRRRRR